MIDQILLQATRFKTLRAYRNGDWRKIPIKESGQSLVQVPKEMTFPFYHSVLKITDDSRIFLREEVLDRVILAQKHLQAKGLGLLVYDGWRSVELQENLFWYYMIKFTAKKFGCEQQLNQCDNFKQTESVFNTLPPETRSAMFEANRTYVSWPSRDLFCPSPHATGGSVDVWPIKDGRAENLGIPFDWMEDNAGAFYHLKYRRDKFLGNDKRVCNNRNALLLAMIKSGFSCYGPEIWHFNFGNQMDALVKGGVAKYSYIEP